MFDLLCLPSDWLGAVRRAEAVTECECCMIISAGRAAAMSVQSSGSCLTNLCKDSAYYVVTVRSDSLNFVAVGFDFFSGLSPQGSVLLFLYAMVVSQKISVVLTLGSSVHVFSSASQCLLLWNGQNCACFRLARVHVVLCRFVPSLWSLWRTALEFTDAWLHFFLFPASPACYFRMRRARRSTNFGSYAWPFSSFPHDKF